MPNISTATNSQISIKVKRGEPVVKLPYGGRVRGVAIEGMRGRHLHLIAVSIADIMRHYPRPEKDAAEWLKKVHLSVARGMPQQYAVDRQPNGTLFAYLWPAPANDMTAIIKYAVEDERAESLVDQGARAT